MNHNGDLQRQIIDAMLSRGCDGLREMPEHRGKAGAEGAGDDSGAIEKPGALAEPGPSGEGVLWGLFVDGVDCAAPAPPAVAGAVERTA